MDKEIMYKKLETGEEIIKRNLWKPTQKRKNRIK
jgi:hypothetical protein